VSINRVSRLSAVQLEDEALDVPLLIPVPPCSYPRIFQNLWRDDSPRLGTVLHYCLTHIFDKSRGVICVLRMFLGFVQNLPIMDLSYLSNIQDSLKYANSVLSSRFTQVCYLTNLQDSLKLVCGIWGIWVVMIFRDCLKLEIVCILLKFTVSQTLETTRTPQLNILA